MSRPMNPNTNPNTANIRAWVDALRSGDYEQGIGALRAEDPWGGPVSYCCLGVACEVAIAHGVDIARDGDAYNGRDGTLPAAAMEWLGVPNDDPVLGGTHATVHNDGFRQSFEQIADAIETEYLA